MSLWWRCMCFVNNIRCLSSKYPRLDHYIKLIWWYILDWAKLLAFLIPFAISNIIFGTCSILWGPKPCEQGPTCKTKKNWDSNEIFRKQNDSSTIHDDRLFWGNGWKQEEAGGCLCPLDDPKPTITTVSNRLLKKTKIMLFYTEDY